MSSGGAGCCWRGSRKVSPSGVVQGAVLGWLPAPAPPTSGAEGQNPPAPPPPRPHVKNGAPPSIADSPPSPVAARCISTSEGVANWGMRVSSLVETRTVRDRVGSTWGGWRLTFGGAGGSSAGLPPVLDIGLGWLEASEVGSAVCVVAREGCVQRPCIVRARGRLERCGRPKGRSGAAHGRRRGARLAAQRALRAKTRRAARATRLHDGAARGGVAPVARVLQAEDDVLWGGRRRGGFMGRQVGVWTHPN